MSVIKTIAIPVHPKASSNAIESCTVLFGFASFTILLVLSLVISCSHVANIVIVGAAGFEPATSCV